MNTSTENEPYLEKRAANSEEWADRARQHGASLAATAATNWVRSTTLRRLRKIVKASCRTLEVGCGNGSSLLGPLSSNCQAYGGDITMEMLQFAKQHTSIKGLVRSDACYLPFKSESFDIVYTSRCLVNVLEPQMQRLAISEIFRIIKKNGSVVLVENFEEPLARVNDAKRRYHAGPPIVDNNNLALNLDRTIKYCEELGWQPTGIQGSSLASFTAHVILPKLVGKRGSGIVGSWLSPVFVFLTALEDRLGSPLPLMGKDVMVVFKRA